MAEIALTQGYVALVDDHARLITEIAAAGRETYALVLRARLLERQAELLRELAQRDRETKTQRTK